MNTFLFELEQFLFPAVTFWPIWVGIAGAFFIAIRMKNALLQRVIKIFCIAALVLVFGIRGLFFIVQPYQSQQFTETNLSLTARFNFDFGEGTITCGKESIEGKTWTIESFSPKNLNKFQQEIYEYNEFGTHYKLELLNYTEKTPMNVISKRWHIENVTIPSSFEKNMLVQYENGKGKISFENCAFSEMRLDAAESQVTVIIPSGQKKYKLRLLGVKSAIVLRLPKNSEINAVESFNTFMTPPEGFTKIAPYKWKKEGNGGPIIDLDVGAGRGGLALEYTD